jgi:hypothetical protein
MSRRKELEAKRCPACGEVAEWYCDEDPGGFPSDAVGPEVTSEGWHCEECDWQEEVIEEDYLREVPHKEWVKSLYARIAAGERKIANGDYPAITVDEIFAHMPEGEFEYEGEPGDWNVYCCGEKDCEQQWHKSSYYETVGRNAEGRRFICMMDCDDTGDREIVDSWEDGDEFDKWKQQWFSACTDEYFLGWARYWLDCYQTKSDPLDEMMGETENWMQYCLEACENNLKYLELDPAADP